jgi:hypothetical protein
MQMAAWKQTDAVKNHRVYEMSSAFDYDLWTLKFQFAVKCLAKWSYPHMYRDLDLAKEKQRMLTTLYGAAGAALVK